MDDITARMGLDSSAFSRGLRSVSAQTDAFSKKTQKQFGNLFGSAFKAVGLVTAIQSFRSLIDAAKEAKETGEAFGKTGWLSPTAVESLVMLDTGFKKVTNTAKEFAGYLLASYVRFERIFGAFTVTGSLKEAIKVADQMAKEDERAVLASKRKKQAEEDAKKALEKEAELQKLLEQLAEQSADAQFKKLKPAEQMAKLLERQKRLEQEIALNVPLTTENIKKKSEAQKDLQSVQEKITALSEKQRAADEALARAAQSRADAETRVVNAEEDEFVAKSDPSKFSIRELAEQTSGRGRFAQEVFGARAVLNLEQGAKRARAFNRPDIAQAMLDRAEGIRRQLTNVVDSERFPFRALEKNTADAVQALQRIDENTKDDNAMQ